MVTVGETDAEPLPSATKPTLLSMLNTISLSVLLVVHESVEEPPGVMEVGLAVRVQAGKGRDEGGMYLHKPLRFALMFGDPSQYQSYTPPA